MKIFITGATGFIGKHLVNYLKEKNEVTINLHNEAKSPFDTSVKTYQLVESNPSKDISFFKKEKFDGIIHLASLYLTTHTSNQVAKLIDSNVRFSTHVLECATQSKIKWFINTGTFWQHYQNKKYSPVNLYSASKQAFESIAQYYWETDQIKFCTLKLSDTFGPDDTRPKVFNLWQKIAVSGETLDMSTGQQLIDISHIDDVISSFVLLANHLKNDHPDVHNGDSFAVKSEKRYTLKELASLFEQAAKAKLNINWGSRSYREREVMVPWEDGKVVPGFQQKLSTIINIRKTFFQ